MARTVRELIIPGEKIPILILVEIDTGQISKIENNSRFSLHAVSPTKDLFVILTREYQH